MFRLLSSYAIARDPPSGGGGLTSLASFRKFCCLLVRGGHRLKEIFSIHLEYFADRADKVTFCDHGAQLTRSFRALDL